MTYELRLTTIHCIGRQDHLVGSVDTQAEAEAWARGATRPGMKLSAVPDKDPIVWCPVTHCHMKRQKPVRSYCKSDSV